MPRSLLLVLTGKPRLWTTAFYFEPGENGLDLIGKLKDEVAKDFCWKKTKFNL
jgi:hypothetical protein